jgi:hypothetical protein
MALIGAYPLLGPLEWDEWDGARITYRAIQTTGTLIVTLIT